MAERKSRRDWRGKFFPNDYGIPYVVRSPVNEPQATPVFPGTGVFLVEWTLDCGHVEGRYLKAARPEAHYVRCHQCQPAAEIIRKRLVDRLRQPGGHPYAKIVYPG
jgi:hypothetical protein